MINRALAVGLLAALLLAVFILVRQIALLALGTEGSGLALALASLAAALLFNPARVRLWALIDRRSRPQERGSPDQDTQTSSETNPHPVPTRSEAAVGTTLARVQIEALIGRGGMAEVYRGRHLTLGRVVAVKVLTPALTADERFRSRFQREAQAVASLDHPNIAALFDAGEQDGVLYIVMEYIEGETLTAFISRRGVLSLAEAIPILSGVAGALDHAHQRGIVHRDVKPHNIMIEERRGPAAGKTALRPVLMDFGIARLVESHSLLTSGSGALGTLDYIAPEQIMDPSRVDGRADLYSLGIVAYQMLTGRLPFTGNSPAAVIMGHLQQPAPDPRKLSPAIPARAAMAVLRAMAKDPDERPPTAAAFVAALERAMN